MILVLTVPLAGWWYVLRPVPSLDGLVSLPELSAPVMVRFDGRGVPYIEANTEADLYLAMGYLTARDRMFQMDMLRRVAEGKLSEVFGVGCLPQDKLMRTIGCGRLGLTESNALSAESKAMLNEYCRGINKYLSTNLDKLPVEFSLLGYRPAPWEPADSMAIMKFLCYSQDESWRLDDLRQRIVDKMGADKAAILFLEDYNTASNAVLRSAGAKAYQADGLPDKLASIWPDKNNIFDPRPNFGSTAWAISGRNSDTGGALLASDKDQALTAPDAWYLCTLSAPGFHAAGATIPGVPGIFSGRNDYISWSSASLKADVQDLVVEEFSPQFPTKYKTASGWQNATEISEEIPVRLSSNVVHKVLVTTHGPVLIKSDSKAVSLSWSGNAVDKPALESLRLINKARDWNEFQQALKVHPGPAQMFVYADHSGNIGYHGAGDIPVRAGKGDGILLVKGWEPKSQWLSKVPFEELPASYNPPSGYLIAANQKLVKGGYAWLLGHQWCAPYRALRLESCFSDLLSHGRKIGLPDCNELLSDQASYLSPLVKREISQALSGAQEIDKYQLAALDLIEHWDGVLKPDSAAAAIYESFLHTLAHRLLVPKLGVELTRDYLERYPTWPLFVERFLKDKSQQWLPPEERTYSTFILTTFSQSVNALRLSLRSDEPKRWTWQSVHKATFRHAITLGLPWAGILFNTGPIGVGGDADSINALDVAGDTTQGEFICRSGPTMRILVDQSDRSKFYQSLSLGQSGHRLSAMARDQLQAWLRVDPLPVAFSTEQLERQSQHKLILTNASLSKPE